MSRNFVDITIDDLKDKILSAYNKRAKSCDENTVLSPFTNESDYLDGLIFSKINSKLNKDLSKIEFDWENFDYGPFSPDSKHLGFHTLPSGLTCLICSAGGDWETPVNFAIYWDGKDIRGYIPTGGNPFNRTTKQAYGNDDVADEDDSNNYGSVNLYHTGTWPGIMLVDIESRITRK